VVGSSQTSAGATHAFITGPNGVDLTDLDMLGGTDSEGYSINNAGQVTGWFREQGREHGHAFITGPNGIGMTDLGTLPGRNNTYAIAINNTGQVAGSS
jgi:probable HAF family extracellular repeat protein